MLFLLNASFAMAILDLISHVHHPSFVNMLPKYLKHSTFSSCTYFTNMLSFNRIKMLLIKLVKCVFQKPNNAMFIELMENAFRRSWLCNGTIDCNQHIRRKLCKYLSYIFLGITNKIHRYTIFFITVHALHVSGGFSALHQELKNCTHSIGYMPSLLAATASVGELELTYASGSSKQAWHIPDAVCTIFELLMMDGETAWNM